MESVMNFLADYYIWFFIGALVLCFALIGFIIDARKKKKNEFKGEAIAEPNVTENVQQVTNNQPQVVGNTVNMEGEATLGSTNTVSDSTMEINDIPMTSTNPVPETKVEFYSGPVEMPTAEPAPVNNEVSNQAQTAATIGEPISFDTNVQTTNPAPMQNVTPNSETNTNNPTNMN